MVSLDKLATFSNLNLTLEFFYSPNIISILKSGVKKPVEFSPAEISAAEEYLTQIECQRGELNLVDRNWSNEKIELERKVEKVIAEFDAKLMELYNLKLSVEKNILTEELKILLHDKNIALLEQLEKNELKMR